MADIDIAFVLGNGKSRLKVNLFNLVDRGAIYGCNALYREFVPDVLISTDPKISEEIQRSGYSIEHVHYTRKPIVGFGSRQIPAEPYGWSSGPVATYLAAEKYNYVYLLGHDLSSDTDKINNIYAGTDCYRSKNAEPTYFGNWVKQLEHVFKRWPSKRFYRVYDDYCDFPTTWRQYQNIEQLHINEFLGRINNL